MKILVIGGSYFFGRMFVMENAGKHDITVVNRGTYSMTEYGVAEIHGDRHDADVWKAVTEDYDAVVDFCAYGTGDIETVIHNISGHIKQYIMISTVDVYKRCGDKNILKDEAFPYEDRSFPGDAGAYISGKVAAEKELVAVCEKTNMAYTILRPAIIYGPYNYAPRESLYFRMIKEKHILPVIEDATGQFQFTYVMDAVRAVEACLAYSQGNNETDKNDASLIKAYNICNPELADYKKFYAVLNEVVDVEYNKIPVNVEQTVTRGLPAPFPLTSGETELCDSSRSVKELGITYTDLTEGMKATYMFS
jgi:nucleoside-diphosphate-sugar epimerase